MITPVTSFLEEQQIHYRLLPHQTPAVSIEDAAKQRGIRTSQMVKSILLRDMSNRLALACAPGHRSVDPKKVRELLSWRRMTCVDLNKIQSLTGYKPGTVTPLLLPPEIPIVFDPSLQQENEVTISSGSDMAGIALSLQDLISLCQPTFADICRS